MAEYNFHPVRFRKRKRTQSCKAHSSQGWSRAAVHLSLACTLTCRLTWQPWYGATRETSLRARFSEKPQLAGISDRGTVDRSPGGKVLIYEFKKRKTTHSHNPKTTYLDQPESVVFLLPLECARSLNHFHSALKDPDDAASF